MKKKPTLTPRKALMLFILAMGGALTGSLLAPRVVTAFHGTPDWLLPSILCVSVLLALVAGYAALNLATSRKQYRPTVGDRDA